MSENAEGSADRAANRDGVEGPSDSADVFTELFDVIEDRRENRPDDSYTTTLFDHEKGVDAILEKLGEETTEVILAAKSEDGEELTQESADLVYHLLVLLAAEGIALEDLRAALRERRG